MTPWYLKILQQLCPHDATTIYVVRTTVTCETIQERCSDCGAVFKEMIDCI